MSKYSAMNRLDALRVEIEELCRTYDLSFKIDVKGSRTSVMAAEWDDSGCTIDTEDWTSSESCW